MDNLLRVFGTIAVALIATWVTVWAVSAVGACSVSARIFHAIEFWSIVSTMALLAALIIRAIWDK